MMRTLAAITRVSTAAAVVALCCCLAAGARPAESRASPTRAAWRALVHWPATWESDWRESRLSGSGVTAFPAGTQRLVVVDCYFGAYQGTQILYLLGRDSKVVGPLPLRTYDILAGGGLRPVTVTVLLGLFSYDAKTRRLTLFDELRGLGDCGLYSSFRLAGSALVPVSVRAHTVCGEGRSLAPSQWPRVALPPRSIR
jgi:hypothetical protein